MAPVANQNFSVKVFSSGELLTNSYLVFHNKVKKGFIVDAPYPMDSLCEFIANEKLKIAFLLLTHGHFDHIGGLKSLDLPFYIHRKDYELLRDPRLNGSSFFGAPLSLDREALLFDSPTLKFDTDSIEIIHTPGHTPGSVSFKFANFLFSGDTIFFGSVGRTDTPLGSYDDLLKSIRKILSLPVDMVIYPGHGVSTTVGRELKHNPFSAAAG